VKRCDRHSRRHLRPGSRAARRDLTWTRRGVEGACGRRHRLTDPPKEWERGYSWFVDGASQLAEGL